MKLLIAVAALAVQSPAMASLTTITFSGQVETQDQAGDDPFVRLGDVLTVSFTFDPATQPRDSFDPRYFNFSHRTPASIFSITTSGGLTWTARDEITDFGVLLSVDGAEPAMAGAHYNRPNSSILPDLIIAADNSFHMQAGNYLYGNTTPSLGFGGRLAFVKPVSLTKPAAVTAIAEPEDWALMILGFLMAGAALRHRRARLALG